MRARILTSPIEKEQKGQHELADLFFQNAANPFFATERRTQSTLGGISLMERERDYNSGRRGERLAKFWLEGQDFERTPAMNRILSPGGWLMHPPKRPIRIWNFIEGQNENRDFEEWIAVSGQPVKTQRHEVKNDVRALTDKIGKQHTEHLYIEVDAAAIENLEEIRRRSRNFCGKENKRAYYHPAEHADYYHFLVSLRDPDFEEIESFDALAEREEIEAFDADERIPDEDALLMALPLEYFISVKGADMKYNLERYAHVKLKENAPRSEKRVGIKLPIYEITEEAREKPDEHGHITLTPIYSLHIKGDCNDGDRLKRWPTGRIWIPARLAKEVVEVIPWGDKVAYLIRQKPLESTTVRGCRMEPFSCAEEIACAAAGGRIYTPKKP